MNLNPCLLLNPLFDICNEVPRFDCDGKLLLVPVRDYVNFHSSQYQCIQMLDLAKTKSPGILIEFFSVQEKMLPSNWNPRAYIDFFLDRFDRITWFHIELKGFTFVGRRFHINDHTTKINHVFVPDLVLWQRLTRQKTGTLEIQDLLLDIIRRRSVYE